MELPVLDEHDCCRLCGAQALHLSTATSRLTMTCQCLDYWLARQRQNEKTSPRNHSETQHES